MKNKDEILFFDIDNALKDSVQYNNNIRSTSDNISEAIKNLNEVNDLKHEIMVAEEGKRVLIDKFFPDKRVTEVTRTSSPIDALMQVTPVDVGVSTEAAKIFVKNDSLFVYGLGSKWYDLYEINLKTGESKTICSTSNGSGYANLVRINDKNCVFFQGGEQPSYGSTNGCYVHLYGEGYGTSTVTRLSPSNSKYMSFSSPVNFRNDKCGILNIGGYCDGMNYQSYTITLNSDLTGTPLDSYVLGTMYKSTNNNFYVLGGHANEISKEDALLLYPNAAFPSESSLSSNQEYIFFEYRFGVESTGSSTSTAYARNKISLLYGVVNIDSGDKIISHNDNLYVIGDRQYEGLSNFESSFCAFTQMTYGKNTYDIYLGFSKKQAVLQIVGKDHYEIYPLPISSYSYYIDEDTKIAYMLDNNNLYTLDLKKIINKPKVLYKKEGIYYKEDNNRLVSIDKSEVSQDDFMEHGVEDINPILVTEGVTVCSYCNTHSVNKIKINGKIKPATIKQTRSHNIINNENQINFPILKGQQDIVKIAFSNNNGYSWRTIKNGNIEVMSIEDIATEGFTPKDAMDLGRKNTVQMLSDKICFAYYIDNNNDKITICPPVISYESTKSIYYGKNDDISYTSPFIKKADENIPELGFVTAIPTISNLSVSSTTEVTEVVDEETQETKTYAVDRIDIPSFSDLKSYYIVVKKEEEE